MGRTDGGGTLGPDKAGPKGGQRCSYQYWLFLVQVTLNNNEPGGSQGPCVSYFRTLHFSDGLRPWSSELCSH